jgi:hypothetical protein
MIISYYFSFGVQGICSIADFDEIEKNRTLLHVLKAIKSLNKRETI